MGGLATGGYEVGFAGPAGGAYQPQFYDGEETGGAADTVNVTAGHQTSGVDAALVALTEVSGTVTDAASHSPLQGVQVTFSSAGTGTVTSATTDAQGHYALSGLPAGSYIALFTPPDASRDVTEYYNGVAEPEQANPIAIASGSPVTGIDEALPAGAQLSGTVTDAVTGAALNGVTVDLYDSAGDYADSASTDSTGSYTFTGLPPGAYKLDFDGSGVGDYPLAYYNGKATLDDADTVSVPAAAAVSGIDAALQHGGQIRGTVTGAPGAALSGVVVTAYDSDGDAAATATTDASGAYDITGLASGTYDVGFDPSAAGNYLPQYYSGAASLNGAQPVAVTTAQTASGIDAVLQTGGQITGTVTEAGSGTPVSGEVVSITDAANERGASATTGANGAYTVGGLSAGTYHVCFFHTPSVGSTAATVCYNGESGPDTPDPVVVRPGQTTTGIDATVPAPQSEGSISGTVTDAVTGAVIPFANVTVYDARGDYFTFAQTDLQGNYDMASSLPPGDYKVKFEAAVGGNYLTQYDGDQPTCRTPHPVQVSAGQTVAGIDAAMAHGAQISGTVTDAATNAPLPNVDVGITDASGALVTTLETDSRGRYVAPALAGGTYKVSFSSTSGGNYVAQTYNDRGSLAQGDPVTVSTGQTAAGINAALQPGATISGTVTDAVTHAGVAGIPVVVYASDGTPAAFGTTDGAGAYTVPRLAPGSYRVGFDDDGTGGYLPQFADGVSSLASARVIAVSAGQSVGGVDAALVTGGQLSGTVTDASTHAPLSGVTVTVYDLVGGGSVGSVQTDGTGAYTVTGLPAGSYAVGFELGVAGYLPQFDSGQSSLAQANAITLAAGQVVSGVDAAMAGGGQISGTITSAATGAALANVPVTVYDASGAAVATASTDGNGAYTAMGLVAGSYRVGFDAPQGANYQSQFADGVSSLASARVIAVSAGQSVGGVDAALVTGGQLSGTVTDASTHAPLSGVTVTVYDLVGGGSVGSVQTDGTGAYTVTGLPAGSYAVGFELGVAGYLPQFDSGQSSLAQANAITLAAGQVVSGVDAAMAGGGQISGTITSAATGAALANVPVTVYDASGAAVATASTDGNGAYTAMGLVAGSYRVGFDAPQGANYQSQFADGVSSLASARVIAVSAGQSVGGVDAALVTGGQLSGTVTDAATHAPLSGVTVTVYDSSSMPVMEADTDSSGGYTVPGLRTGSYTVGFDTELAGSDYLAQEHGASSPTAPGTSVSVTAGQTTTGADGALAPGGDISGTGQRRRHRRAACRRRRHRLRLHRCVRGHHRHRPER